MSHGDDGLIPKHGGYATTKTWALADLIYDVTVRFCDLYVDRRSRTHDQMVQAARSGCQNLQEGSVDSATSKKVELKLTGIAKGSLEELRRDYEKHLAHHGLDAWEPTHPALARFKRLRCGTLAEFRGWVADEYGRQAEDDARLDARTFGAVCAANGALSLLNLCNYLIGRQMEAQAKAFEEEGGFTERMYRRRQAHKRRS